MKVEDLAARAVVSVVPDRSVRQAARAMADRGVGSAVVLTGDTLAGILTERDVLKAVADGADLDATPAKEIMTADVVTVGPDWEVYEAAAEMAGKHIRHLVVAEDDRVAGVLSVRDLLLAGQRVDLSEGGWVVLRDPLTFAVRERRKLQRYLLQLRGNAEPDLADLTGLVVGSWSFDLPLPPDAQTLDKLPPADREALRAAVLAELPELQRAVHPAPGWRRR
ncbi:MAG: CBS domain-containing protein [Mycobacterium sp.]